MVDAKIIEVECGCGQKLAKYRKVGSGRLRKMYLDMILDDKTGVFKTDLKTGENIFCINCNNRIATIQMIHGRPAAKMNQGVIKKVGS